MQGFFDDNGNEVNPLARQFCNSVESKRIKKPLRPTDTPPKDGN